MPPKPKKQTPKQLLAIAEARVAALTHENAVRERELGDTIARLAASIAECKQIILKQQQELASTFDARVAKLQVELSAERATVAALQQAALSTRAAQAESDTLEAERAHLLRQVAEAVASREAAERSHVADIMAMKQGMTSLRLRLEEKFKVRSGERGPSCPIFLILFARAHSSFFTPARRKRLTAPRSARATQCCSKRGRTMRRR